MKVVFCGTPQFAVPTLKHLLTRSDFEIAAVVTQPDRPSGRGMHVSFSPVKEAALAAGVPVLQPEKIRSPEAQEFLQRVAPECIVIIAYGQIIPARLLPIPKHGWINLHASLLPKYRGAAPINWAIVNGETKSGLTTMRIDAGMDTGDMLLQTEVSIGPQETTPELAARMADAGAPLMVDTLRGLADGTLPARPQDHGKATYAPLLKKEDGRIDWTRTANEIYNRMRGFTPWPGSYTTFRGRTCHVLGEPVSNDLSGVGSPHATQASLAKSPTEVSPPGTIRFSGHKLFVACGDATEIRVVSVKQEGGKKVDALEFASGARLTEGERFVNT
ncbi:MAG: methionyl-tRNA formyltransferase [Candidatus Acidiferrum sp.]|jgi:methionyl-tRNA formyltransferase